MIRPLHTDNWPRVLMLARQMHVEGWFRDYDFQIEKVRNIFNLCLEDPSWFAATSWHEDELTGFIAGIVVPHYFGSDLYASDLALFVEPDRRGGTAGFRLIRAFETWAREAGAREILLGVSTDVMPDRTLGLYKSMGYGSVTYTSRKKLR